MFVGMQHSDKDEKMSQVQRIGNLPEKTRASIDEDRPLVERQPEDERKESEGRDIKLAVGERKTGPEERSGEE
jgi:hypothetical protein